MCVVLKYPRYNSSCVLPDCVGCCCCVCTAHARGKPRVGPAVFVTPVNPTQASKPKQGARDPLMTANKLGKERFSACL